MEIGKSCLEPNIQLLIFYIELIETVAAPSTIDTVNSAFMVPIRHIMDDPNCKLKL